MIEIDKYYLVQRKFNNVLRENQELKMELTELKNAFDLNREVLYILSGKSEPTKRYFYLMLKKMNQSILDLSETIIKLKRQRLEKIQEYKQLQMKFYNMTDEINHQKKEIQKLYHRLDQSESNNEEKTKATIFSPKQIHIILTEEIRKITNELFTMGDLYSKSKKQNQKLKKYIQAFEEGYYSGRNSGRNSKIGSSKNLSEESPKESFKKRTEFLTHMYDKRNKQEEIQENISEYDNITEKQINEEDENSIEGASNQTKYPHELLVSPFTQKQNNNFTKYHEKNQNLFTGPRFLDLRIEKYEQEINLLKKQNLQINQRLKLLIKTQKMIIDRHSKKKSPTIQREISLIMELIEWRSNIAFLDQDKDFIFKQSITKSKSFQKLERSIINLK